MRIAFKVPAVIRAIPPRVIYERPALCEIDVVSEICELPESEMDIVADIRLEGTDLVVARRGETLYRRIGPLANASLDVETALRGHVGLTLALMSSPLFGAARRDLKLWPSNAEGRLYALLADLGRTSSPQSGCERLEAVGLACLSAPNEDDLDWHTTRASGLCSKMAVSGGMLWRVVRNPFLLVTGSSFAMHDATFYEFCELRLPVMPAPFGSNLEYVVEGSYFDLDLSPVPVAPPRPGDPCDPSMEIYFAGLEFERVVKACLVAMMRPGEKYSEEVVKSLHALYRASAPISRDSAAFLEDLESAATRLVATLESKGYRDWKPISRLREALDLWAERPVAVEVASPSSISNAPRCA